jgi:hypothetical protein
MVNDNVEEVFEARAPRSIGLQHKRVEMIASFLTNGCIAVILLLLCSFGGTKWFLGFIDGKCGSYRLSNRYISVDTSFQ